MATLITGAGMLGTMAALRLFQAGESCVLYDLAPRLDAISGIAGGSNVKVISGDIFDLPFLVSTIRDEKIDRVIHTAGLLRPADRTRPYYTIRVNIGGTAVVLRWQGWTGSSAWFSPAAAPFTMPSTLPRRATLKISHPGASATGKGESTR